MKRIFCVILPLCLLLTGCMGWMDGSYQSVTPHAQSGNAQQQYKEISDYSKLRAALVELVENGQSSGILSVENFPEGKLEASLKKAVDYIGIYEPMGAYAVEEITYETGTTGGIPAVAVNITYNVSRTEILKLRQAKTMEQAQITIAKALSDCESVVVVKISDYTDKDFTQFVEDYADQNPDLVMETPQVTANIYPEGGSVRIVELRFTYQSSRESLRHMQSYVKPIFQSSTLNVSAEEEQRQKYARLRTFLMERSDNKIETSITPAYSLLRHGVGDSKAFSVVFSAMCRKAGLECMVVSGTKQGKAWFWNIICEDGVYYHVDLLEGKSFQRLKDEQMTGYVWDYSAYPACGIPPAQPDATQPQ